jgi:hypothetical protein
MEGYVVFEERECVTSKTGRLPISEEPRQSEVKIIWVWRVKFKGA